MTTNDNEYNESEGNDATTIITITAPLHHAASLPSIDELEINHSLLLLSRQEEMKNNNNGNGGVAGATTRSSATSLSPIKDRRHRRVSSVTTAPSSSSSTFSKASYHAKSRSTSSNKSSISSSSSAVFQTTQLLQNMMRSHKNRNPYKDYLVLGMIGKGSIGSVEKVVRRHHSVLAHHGHGYLDDDDDNAADGGDGDDNGDCWDNTEATCCWGLFSKLFNKNQSKQYKQSNKDAFQSTSAINGNNKNKSAITHSIVSESSAFSAPSTPTMPHFEQRQRRLLPPTTNRNTEIRSSSQHGNMALSTHPFGSLHSSIYNHNHAHQHPLRRYALKSIRLDRTTTTTKKKNNNDPSSTASPGISSSDEAELRNEISILRSLDHPHIVHIIETYEYKSMIYMVIDLCENGDLYVLDPYSEGEARMIMRQLLQAVSYMHHRGIVHRDLKVRD